MKREDVLAIIKNADIDETAKLDQIMDLNGSDINDLNSKIAQLSKSREPDLSGYVSKGDFEKIAKERDDLLKEKTDREYSDRFKAVLGDHKPKNSFTMDGMSRMFREAAENPENKEKDDATIFSEMVKDRESEFFENPVRISMTAPAKDIKLPSEIDAYFDEEYKNNPFYKK